MITLQHSLTFSKTRLSPGYGEVTVSLEAIKKLSNEAEKGNIFYEIVKLTTGLSQMWPQGHYEVITLGRCCVPQRSWTLECTQ